MDSVQEMLKYVDTLYKRAFALSGDENDANDLVQETYLSVLISINKGLEIQNVKSYLLGVLKNKHFDMCRKKYNMPNLDQKNIDLENIDSYISCTGMKKTEISNAIRRELAYLPKIYREVLVQYYLEKKKVHEIATNLNISNSAVMLRLDRGRDKLKEGVIRMEPLSVNSFNPDHLLLYVSGNFGINNEPMSVITNMIEQNALILAYEKPIFIKEISEQLGIPMVFAEEAVDKLVSHELMKRVGTKVFTNFPIIDDDSMHDIYEVQKSYVNNTFADAKLVFDGLADEYRKLNLFNEYNDNQIYLYSIFSVIYGVHSHLFDVLNLHKFTDYPDRPNSGKWLIDFGHKRNKLDNELLKSLHRLESEFITSNSNEVTVEIRDINLGLSSWLTKNARNLQDVGELLYYISIGDKYEHLKTYMIPDLIGLGLIYKDANDELKSNIPVISHNDYEKIMQLSQKYTMRYMDTLGDKLLKIVKNNVIKYPKQINPVSYKTQLISMHGITQTYEQKAVYDGVIEKKEGGVYPMAVVIVKRSVECRV